MDNKENCNLDNGSNDATVQRKEKVVLDIDHSSVDENIPSEHHKSHHHSSHHSHHGSHHGKHRGGHHHRSHKHNSKKKFKFTSKLGWMIVICTVILFIVLVVIIDGRRTDHSDPSIGDQTSGILNVEVYNQEGLLVKNAVNKYLLTDLLSLS